MKVNRQDRQVALRLTADTIARAERLAPLMQKQPEWAPFRITASAALRIALLKGLDELEEQLKVSRKG